MCDPQEKNAIGDLNGVNPNKSVWLTQYEYEQAIQMARLTKKPILLHFYSESCPDSKVLANMLGDPRVVERVTMDTVPVRIDVDGQPPNSITSTIIGSHIFIWSQTLQLVSADGDIYHKFIGAPRHTRLDLGYTSVHHDVGNQLTADDLLMQLRLGLAKRALFECEYERASEELMDLCNMIDSHNIANIEARYWLPIAQNKGEYFSSQKRGKTESKAPLARAIERISEALIQIPDSELLTDWYGRPGPDEWAKYSDCLREVFFGIYQSILDTAHLAAQTRDNLKQPPTIAQRILKMHQLAYRELQGVMVGLKGRELDQIHLRQNFSLGKQRSIRNNFVHCVMAEWWAHGAQIRNTLRRMRDENKLSLSANDIITEFGHPPDNFGDIQDTIERSEQMHQKLLTECITITDKEVDARAAWWEDQPVAIRFRLNRLGWHLHDHIAVIDTILERIGRKRSETERLARLLYRALGELEGTLLGVAEEDQAKITATLRMELESRAKEFEQLADKLLQSEY